MTSGADAPARMFGASPRATLFVIGHARRVHGGIVRGDVNPVLVSIGHTLRLSSRPVARQGNEAQRF